MQNLSLKLILVFSAITMLATVPVVAQADDDRQVPQCARR